MERRDPVQRLTPEELRWDRGSVRAPGVFRTRTMTRTCTCPEKSTRGGGPLFFRGRCEIGKAVRGIRKDRSWYLHHPETKIGKAVPSGPSTRGRGDVQSSGPVSGSGGRSGSGPPLNPTARSRPPRPTGGPRPSPVPLGGSLESPATPIGAPRYIFIDPCPSSPSRPLPPPLIRLRSGGPRRQLPAGSPWIQRGAS